MILFGVKFNSNLENNSLSSIRWIFFELFTLPLGDINEQNTRMNEGEKSEKNIQGHVDEWIAKNQDKWNGWLTEARSAVK